MAQINEYLPDASAQGAVGGVTPNLEAVSLFGRGVEHVGASIEQASDVVHRRQAQQEVSQVYGQFAQARADWNIKVKERLRDGTLDPDKLDQEYADYVNKAGSDLQTAEGKDFFNRQANRLGGTLMQNAIIGKAKIAGEQAYADISTGVNVHVANLMAHPEQIDDALGSTEELISAKSKDGTLTPEQAIQAKKQLLPELAMASLKGLAEQDQGVDENGKPYENLAKQSLDKEHFSEYLNQQQRSEMYNYARTAENRKQTDKERESATAHRLLEKQGNDYMDGVANRVLNGSYSLKELQTAPLTFQQKEYLTAKVKAQAMDESRTDPRRFNNVYSDIIHGNITTRDQLAAEFDKGGLAPATMDHLTHELDATPEGHLVKNMQKNLDREAQDLRFKGVGGVYTQAGDAAYTNFQTELYQERQKAQAQGITDRQFYSNTNAKDPTSPLAILNKYRLNAMDRARLGATEAMGQVTGQAGNGDIRYSNSPTKEIPPPQAAPSQPTPAAPTQQAPQAQPDQAGPASQGGGELQDALESFGLSGPAVEAKKKAAADRLEAQRAEQRKFGPTHINRPAPTPEAPPTPANDMWKPGEDPKDLLKRLGKR